MAEPTRGPAIGTATNVDDPFQDRKAAPFLERLNYDSATGHFTWKPGCQRGRGERGRIAGTPTGRANYIAIRINGVMVMAHHLAWFFVHKKWNEGQLDHIDLDGMNNRIDNLRPATNSQNLANRRRQKNNTSGIKGVSKHRGKWAANISVNGKSVYLGVYESIEDATAAYRKAAKEIYGEFARLM